MGERSEYDYPDTFEIAEETFKRVLSELLQDPVTDAGREKLRKAGERLRRAYNNLRDQSPAEKARKAEAKKIIDRLRDESYNSYGKGLYIGNVK